MYRRLSLSRLWSVTCFVLCAGVSIVPAAARAEVASVRLAQQFGFASLPLMVMQQQKLVEKHLLQEGLTTTKVEWRTFSGGSMMNDALLTGDLDFAAGGVTPLLTLWDKSHGKIKGVASCGSVPLVLMTRDPNVKSVKDFTRNDKIAVPAIKVSIQAVFLQMASAKVFGPKQFDRLNPLTVSMRHPDAAAALLSNTEVTSHITSSPFVEQELQNPAIHQVLSSEDVLGPTTNVALYATTAFHDKNPRTYRAVLDALTEAMAVINRDKQLALTSFLAVEHSRLPADVLQKAIANPANHYTIVPQGIQKYADFMASIGMLKHKPANWKEVFYPEIHNQPGS